MRYGGIVLCGGKSSRMGQSKAWLPWGNRTCLQQVVAVVQQAVPMVCVVAAPDQALPALPESVRIVRDPEPHFGPLSGLQNGLLDLQTEVDAVFLTGCDHPLLKSAFITHMLSELGNHDVVLPRDADHRYPLTAVYRVSVLPEVQRLVAAQQLRLVGLLEQVASREVPAEVLRGSDPELDSLCSANTPEEYARLCLRSGGVA